MASTIPGYDPNMPGYSPLIKEANNHSESTTKILVGSKVYDVTFSSRPDVFPMNKNSEPINYSTTITLEGMPYVVTVSRKREGGRRNKKTRKERRRN